MKCSCGSSVVTEKEVNTFYDNNTRIIRQTFCQCQSCGRCFWKYEYFIKNDLVEYKEARTL